MGQEMEEIVTTIDDLKEICEEQKTIIIYGAGMVGSLLVQYMLKNGYNDKLFCIAVKSMKNNPDNILGIPVCALKDLGSYKENILFIIGTYENQQTEILSELKIFGCLKTKRISNLLCAALRQQVTDFSAEIYNMLHTEGRQIQKIYEKVIQLESQITTLREMNEVYAVHTKSFYGFENKFRDKEVVIVGAGPTLNNYTPMEGAIHIGVNTVYRYEKIHLDYLFVQDANRAINYKEKFKGIEQLDCPVFVGRYLCEDWAKKFEFPEKYRVQQNIHNYYLDVKTSKHIYRDICYHPLMDFGSVIFAAIHFALYTYPKKIYLVGCDVSNEGYFFQSDCVTQRNIERDRKKDWLPGYQRVKSYAQFHYPDMEIVSVNPVGLRGLFRDIYTDQYQHKRTNGVKV